MGTSTLLELAKRMEVIDPVEREPSGRRKRAPQPGRYHRDPNLPYKVPRWSDEETAYLLERYPHEPAQVVAAALGKSVMAVRNKANRLSVRQFGQEDMTLRDVATLMGRDHRSVRRWLTTGQLAGWQGNHDTPAGGSGRPADMDYWHIKPADVRGFILRHPAEVDRGTCDFIWLVCLLGGAQRAVLTRQTSRSAKGW